MKNLKLFSNMLLVIIVFIVILVVSSTRANAQEDVVRYLGDKFEEQNIPVVEITVLDASPLRLRIVVQSADEWTNTDDTVILNAVDRAVFIYARQEGFVIESLVRILQDSQGKQLDYTEKQADSERLDQILALNISSAILTDEDTKTLLLEEINPFLDEYNLHGVPIALDVSSTDGYQTLTLNLQTSSLDDANNAAFFFWSLPHFSLFNKVNSEGAKIVLYRAKIIDEKGANLLDYMYDFQLGSGGWTQDERLAKLGGDPGSTTP
jgi:hypothetical protein